MAYKELDNALTHATKLTFSAVDYLHKDNLPRAIQDSKDALRLLRFLYNQIDTGTDSVQIADALEEAESGDTVEKRVFPLPSIARQLKENLDRSYAEIKKTAPDAQ